MGKLRSTDLRLAPGGWPDGAFQAVLEDYITAEDALRAFTDRNFGQMCAICARWTLLVGQVNRAAQANRAAQGSEPGDGLQAGPESATVPESTTVPEPANDVSWRLGSWVTNCCNANHALESMSDESLAGVVASREHGTAWWQQVQQTSPMPCAALTEQGCSLRRGRPELCNTYFCEAVRDYLWLIGGERRGKRLAQRLDTLQRAWACLYQTYQGAARAARRESAANGATGAGGTSGTGGASGDRGFNGGVEVVALRQQLRKHSGWLAFQRLLGDFDREIAWSVCTVTAPEMTDRLFKVTGNPSVYQPFFAREVAAIGGVIRQRG